MSTPAPATFRFSCSAFLLRFPRHFPGCYFLPRLFSWLLTVSLCFCSIAVHVQVALRPWFFWYATVLLACLFAGAFVCLSVPCIFFSHCLSPASLPLYPAPCLLCLASVGVLYCPPFSFACRLVVVLIANWSLFAPLDRHMGRRLGRFRWFSSGCLSLFLCCLVRRFLFVSASLAVSVGHLLQALLCWPVLRAPFRVSSHLSFDWACIGTLKHTPRPKTYGFCGRRCPWRLSSYCGVVFYSILSSLPLLVWDLYPLYVTNRAGDHLDGAVSVLIFWAYSASRPIGWLFSISFSVPVGVALAYCLSYPVMVGFQWGGKGFSRFPMGTLRVVCWLSYTWVLSVTHPVFVVLLFVLFFWAL